MYSSVYWNAGMANQPIFESSQGRFTGGYWDLQDAYIRNSPVYFAKNVKTPLLLLHNDKDGAVDFTQGVEYYNTLRRLQKPVVMLQYKGREPRASEAGEPQGLRDSDAGVLRPLPEGQARAGLVEGRRPAPEDGRSSQDAAQTVNNQRKQDAPDSSRGILRYGG